MQGKAPDWQDFVGIITLLLINSTISFIEENNAGNAAAALMARLAPKAKVINGKTSYACCLLSIVFTAVSLVMDLSKGFSILNCSRVISVVFEVSLIIF